MIFTNNPPPRAAQPRTIMKQYKGTIRTNKTGSDCEFEFEVEDGASMEEIEIAAQQAAFEMVEWHYVEAK
jgi:hypothetical protein